mmetsp:Transcript_46433/g.91626  ORF Transcript_46433/g.91626 Transcript_46433/m.91626 type:complete len:128 (-) Transcript_46433:3056-3439(-)
MQKAVGHESVQGSAGRQAGRQQHKQHSMRLKFSITCFPLSSVVCGPCGKAAESLQNYSEQLAVFSFRANENTQQVHQKQERNERPTERPQDSSKISCSLHGKFLAFQTIRTQPPTDQNHLIECRRGL